MGGFCRINAVHAYCKDVRTARVENGCGIMLESSDNLMLFPSTYWKISSRQCRDDAEIMWIIPA
ncbi:MAG: hypothetical protein ACRCU1_03920, partial [Alsobacter sp.]